MSHLRLISLCWAVVTYQVRLPQQRGGGGVYYTVHVWSQAVTHG